MCLYVYSECTCVCLWRPKVDKSSIILLRYSLTRVGLSVKFRIHPYVCSMTPLSLPMDARIQADGHAHQTFMWVSGDPVLVLSLVWQVL